MIKLVSLLNEITTDEKATSWLSRDGNFYPVSYSHHSTALKITHMADAPETFLMKKGFQRVSYYTMGTLYCNNEFVPPNDLQKRLLIQLTQDLGFDELRFDDGKYSYKILWSKEDVLEESYKYESNLTSWLKPNGEFIPIPDTHPDYAYKIVGGDPKEDHCLILFKKGWQRISHNFDKTTLFTDNEVMIPNNIQKRKLIDLAKENNFSELKYDNGNKSKIIWSKQDTLQ